jgi:twitching motility protein PilT
VTTTVIGGRADALLDILWQARGSDLLLTAGMQPQIRIDGQLRPVTEAPVLTGADTEELLAELLSQEQAAERSANHEYDFSFTWRDTARIRGNAFRQRGETAVALRMVTGPTGSGKSTTLASVINQINFDRACHIVTIEDPIEYMHEHRRSMVSQREVGTDTKSFSDALRAALREDPDVLLVGEMRDLESIGFALTLAETGHQVFATLHTNDTSQALARIIDVFPAHQQAQVRVQLAAALTGIVYQRLIPRINGGMVAAYEVLVADSAVRNLIKEGKQHQLRNALVSGQRAGMQTLEQSLSALVQSGMISYDDAAARSLYPRDIEVRPRVQVGAGS